MKFNIMLLVLAVLGLISSAQACLKVNFSVLKAHVRFAGTIVDSAFGSRPVCEADNLLRFEKWNCRDGASFEQHWDFNAQKYHGIYRRPGHRFDFLVPEVFQNERQWWYKTELYGC